MTFIISTLGRSNCWTRHLIHKCMILCIIGREFHVIPQFLRQMSPRKHSGAMNYPRHILPWSNQLLTVTLNQNGVNQQNAWHFVSLRRNSHFMVAGSASYPHHILPLTNVRHHNIECTYRRYMYYKLLQLYWYYCIGLYTGYVYGWSQSE